MIFLIRWYQLLVRPLLRGIFVTLFGVTPHCRFSPSCSEYTILQIKKSGTISGLRAGLKQFLRCSSLTS